MAAMDFYRKLLFPGGDLAHLIQAVLVLAFVKPVWDQMRATGGDLDSAEFLSLAFITLWMLTGTAIIAHGLIGFAKAAGVSKKVLNGTYVRDLVT